MEILEFTGTRLKVRIRDTFNRILYVLPDVLEGGFEICYHGSMASGSEPGELDLIVDAPMDTTPNSP